MATADKLAKLAETKSNIKQAIIDKGVSVSDTDTFASYASKIGQIEGGGGPTTIFGVPIRLLLPTVDENGLMTTLRNLPTQSPLYSQTVVDVDLSSVVKVDYNPSIGTTSPQQMYMFDALFEGLTCRSINISNLKEINQAYAFNRFLYRATASDNFVKDISFDSLESFNGTNNGYALQYMFNGQRGIQSLRFPKLKKIDSPRNFAYIVAAGNTPNGHIYFNSLRNDSFSAMTGTNKSFAFFALCGGCTGWTVHFPSNTEELISSLNGYPNFSGTSTTILFDLPSTGD